MLDGHPVLQKIKNYTNWTLRTQLERQRVWQQKKRTAEISKKEFEKW
jgi:hypothetical protein